MQLSDKVKSVANNATRKEEQMEKLKARIDEMFSTRAAFAEAIGVDPSILSRMLASGNWKADRIEKAVAVLNTPATDIPAYFFPSTVANKTTEEVKK